ncbi:MAG: hypothetical protein PHW63_08935 [Alphaproteobacteria bacterium]|nr:hypothetical protein [Alphaproteobacteria bacterium]
MGIMDPNTAKDFAADLLSQISYATALTNPATSRALASLPSDVDLVVEDERAGEAMYANAAVRTVPVSVSLAAPIVKAIAKRRDQGVKENYERVSQIAGRKRLQHVSRIIASGGTYLTWDAFEVTWPREGRLDCFPLDIHLSEAATVVALNPYQIQACGYAELIRACGDVIGNGNGEWLVDQYLRMILTLSGVKGRGGDRLRGEELLSGEFLRLAQSREPVPEVWEPLPGRSRMLAITVLAAWLRMARLGVDLLNFDRLEAWDKYFDGTLYSANQREIGEIWSQRDPRGTYERSDFWYGTSKAPWHVESSGSPVVVVGIAGEILKFAIAAVQPIGYVPDNFDIHEGARERSFDFSDRILVQLRNHYREISGCSVGSVISVVPRN